MMDERSKLAMLQALQSRRGRGMNMLGVPEGALPEIKKEESNDEMANKTGLAPSVEEGAEYNPLTEGMDQNYMNMLLEKKAPSLGERARMEAFKRMKRA